MRRAPLVIAGTALGLGLLLTYRTPQLATPAAASTSVSGGSTHSGGASNSSSAGSGTGGSGGSGTGGSTGSTGSAAGTATGTSIYDGFGNVQVKVTVSGGKITSVTPLQLPNGDPQSQQISNYASPQLVQQAMAAQSAHINGVSGATYTSQAFAQSLQSALTQLGM